VHHGSKRSHSSRPSKAGASPSGSANSTNSQERPKSTDFDALLERFSNALSVVATAARSLTLAQGELEAIPEHDIGEDIHTLEQGVGALCAVYNELDVAIREVRQ
jgi:hypothetical protein